MIRRLTAAAGSLALVALLSVGAQAQAKPAQQKLDINNATREQLLAFPGIGQAYADKIIAGRPYKMRSDLVARGIMPAANYLKIKANLIPSIEDAKAIAELEAAAAKASRSPEPMAAGMVDINTASRADLVALPGVGEAYADKIMAGRPYKSKNELVSRNILTKAAFDRIKDRITAVQ